MAVDAVGALTDLDPASARGASKKKRGDVPAQLPRRIKVSGYAAGAEFERLTGLLVRSGVRLTFDLAVPFGIDGETVEGLHTFEQERAAGKTIAEVCQRFGIARST